MKRDSFFKIVIVLCVVLGIGFLLQGVKETIEVKNIKETYITTQGQYVDKELYRASSIIGKYKKHSTYYLLYEYRVNDKTYIVKTDYGSGQIPLTGSTREVYYNPDSPEEAVLGGTDSSSILVWFGILFILVPSVMAIGMLAIKGKLGRLTFNIMDIAVGSVLIIVGIGTIRIFSGDFSLIGLFKLAGPFALIPILFIVVGIPTVCKGFLLKHSDK